MRRRDVQGGQAARRVRLRVNRYRRRARERPQSGNIHNHRSRISPVPLLSVDACTARSTTITTTDPALFFVLIISSLDVSVTANCKMSGPGKPGVEGNICPNQ